MAPVMPSSSWSNICWDTSMMWFLTVWVRYIPMMGESLTTASSMRWSSRRFQHFWWPGLMVSLGTGWPEKRRSSRTSFSRFG